MLTTHIRRILFAAVFPSDCVLVLFASEQTFKLLKQREMHDKFVRFATIIKPTATAHVAFGCGVLGTPNCFAPMTYAPMEINTPRTSQTLHLFIRSRHTRRQFEPSFPQDAAKLAATEGVQELLQGLGAAVRFPLHTHKQFKNFKIQNLNS